MASKVSASTPRIGAHAEVAVVHLARFGNGESTLNAFLASYTQHAAGATHDLVVLLKGYADKPDAERTAQTILRAYNARTLTITDDGLDLDAYREAIGAFDYSYYCFVNSFSRFTATNWLRHMLEAAKRPGVGIVGATGSFQSVSSDELIALRSQVQRIPRKILTLLSRTERSREVDRRGSEGRRLASPTTVSAETRHPIARILHALKYASRRLSIAGSAILHYAFFPNAHIRTNAFLLPRDVLARITWPKVESKRNAYYFESGRSGLTTQIVGLGLEPIVVGRDGRQYVRREWPSSRTFWHGNQENLLIQDNQTTQYQRGSDDERRRLCRHAWRDLARSAPGPAASSGSSN